MSRCNANVWFSYELSMHNIADGCNHNIQFVYNISSDFQSVCVMLCRRNGCICYGCSSSITGVQVLNTFAMKSV